MDFGWKFNLGDPQDAQAAAFDDSGWPKLDLPHDWSIVGKIAGLRLT
jgi:beta-galactosidase